jgi:hypothetical protein
MKSSASGWLTLAGAVALVLAVTVAQGFLTERWKDKTVTKDLQEAAKILEDRFPKSFGGCELERAHILK